MTEGTEGKVLTSTIVYMTVIGRCFIGRLTVESVND